MSEERWHSYVKDNPELLGPGFLIAKAIDKAGKNVYRLFRNFIEFAKYNLRREPVERVFFEVIDGSAPQRPYLDIDIKESDNINLPLFMNIVVSAIQSIVDDKSFDVARDLVVCSSSGRDGETLKLSYHIILCNHYVRNHQQAAAFYKELMKMVPEEYTQVIDRAVYKSRQNLRLLGSHKLGSKRVKRVVDFMYQGKIVEHIYPREILNENQRYIVQLQETIIGQVLGSLLEFPEELPEYPRREKVFIAQEDARLAFSLYEETVDAEELAPFVFGGVDGNFIRLNRVMLSWCCSCEKEHEKDNAYLIVNNGRVYFGCFRSEKGTKTRLLGKLGDDEVAGGYSVEILWSEAPLDRRTVEESPQDSTGSVNIREYGEEIPSYKYFMENSSKKEKIEVFSKVSKIIDAVFDGPVGNIETGPRILTTKPVLMDAFDHIVETKHKPGYI